MKILLSAFILLQSILFLGQTVIPNNSTPFENNKKSISNYKKSLLLKNRNVITTPPVGDLRTMAEWEEVQSICITWTGFKSILAQIVEEVQTECEVIILCNDSSVAQNELSNYNVSLENVSFVPANFNSIWMRDYGGNSVYKNYVDSLILVDWIYNRSRPLDNSSPAAIGEFKGIPVYEMSEAGNDLVHTGGNFMADGFGTGFSSELVDYENSAEGDYNLTNKTPEEVDQLMFNWMGVDPYIKMTVLPFDDIHHIDMHMKLIDEETLLVGEFPEDVSDGPQIEMNIQYIQDNFSSVFGTPYKIKRIPMIPSFSGGYPDGGWGEPYYRTYANNLIVNKKVLVPTYRTQYDSTGLRILREAMPGYEVIGIDCDNSGANIIGSGGAIHCITKAIGTNDPLLISHQQLSNTSNDLDDYHVDALIMHKSGISDAILHYKSDLDTGFYNVIMNNIFGDTWSGAIPSQSAGSTVSYYISAVANSGKTQLRPITAPDGHYFFKVENFVSVNENQLGFGRIFPNPSDGLTCIELSNNSNCMATLQLLDISGRKLKEIFKGEIISENRKYFVDISDYSTGSYLVELELDGQRMVKKLFID